MAVRVATMSPMDNSSPAGKPQHLSRKLVLLLLLTSAYALGLVLLFRKRPDFPLILFSYFADCTLAVVAGLGARLVLSKRGWFIRSFAAMVMAIAGQVILGYFTQWKIGLDVPQFLLGYMSWVDLSHLTLGLLAALSAVWAWRRSRPNPELGDFSAPVVVTPLRSNADPSAQSRIRLPQSWSLHLGSMTRPREGAHSGNGNHSSAHSRLKLITGQAVRPKPRRSSRQKLHVQLALVEEHRCPYCLEPVSRSDPRGVKECEVCHALHHADCWAITGTCQVPHLNS
jgi:hypothetical protein